MLLNIEVDAMCSPTSDGLSVCRFLRTTLYFLLAMSVVLSVSTLVACGGGSNNRQAEVAKEQTDTPTGESRVQPAADQAVLKLEDLPSGWVEGEPSTEDGSDPCGTKELRSRESARAESKDFSQNDDQVSETVSVYGDDGIADQTVSDFVDRMKSCDPKAILDEMSKASLPEGVSVKDATIGRLSFEKLGDRTEALRLALTFSVAGGSGNETTLDVPYDFVVIRSGRMVGAVYVLELSGSSTVADDMANLAASKLTAASMTLAGSAGSSRTPNIGGTATTKTTVTPPTTTTGQLGQAQKIGTMRITIYSLEKVEPGMFNQPTPGDEFIAFDAEACSDADKGNVNPFDFEVEMPDHTRRSAAFGDREPALHSTDLATGDCVRGWVTFETPAGVRPSFVVYSGGYGTNPFKWSVP